MDKTGLAAAAVVVSPLLWNILARNEYRHHTLERFFGGKRRGCYALALWIFLSSAAKDWLFAVAIKANPGHTIVSDPQAARRLHAVGTAALAVGTGLVVSAFARLGVTGTYLGDYFGILKDARVTGFPFNVLENPMYVGATLNFVGLALQHNNSVGLALSAWVFIVYDISTRWFENPFTNMIYSQREQQRQQLSK